MSIKHKKCTKKFKRRSFFYLMSVVTVGTVILSKIPFKILSGNKINDKIKENLKITENPYAVKRETRKRLNGT